MSGDPGRAVHVAHVITTLDVGGAEVMLWKLLSRLRGDAWRHTVFVLRGRGEIADRIEALGVPVHALSMSRAFPNPLPVLALARELRRLRVDVVQTWLYHGDLLGGMAARVAGRIPTIWNIRGHVDPARSRRTTLWVRALAARCSRWIPAAIVCCSESDRTLHGSLGYDTDRMTVIPNGFDVSVFRPDPNARAAVRAELGIQEHASVVGLVARFDQQKDHRTFVSAAALIAERWPEAVFVLCGRGVTDANRTLRDWIDATGHAHAFRLLGQRTDLPRLNAAFDVAVSSSAYGEGFPNAIGEAMACAVPCVVTDVSDSSVLVGDTGRVVPPGHPDALATACLSLVADADERARLGGAARRRVCERFAIDRIAAQYAALYTRTSGLQ